MLLLRAAGAVCILGLAACAATPGEDYGFDSKPLSDLRANGWVDPNGCEHWVIDDGVEGYLTPRRNRDGTPVCPKAGSAPGTAGITEVTFEAIAWTDPNGCQHWASDHGVKGFMSERLARDGTPVCPGKVKPLPEVITLGADALFDTNKSDLRPEAIAELDDFGSKMNKLKKTRLRITGHTDSRGSEPYNQGLSERRAASVAAYLAQNFGLQSETGGLGESSPVAENTTTAGRQANRRVEITILD